LNPFLPSLVSKGAPENAYGTALGAYNTLQFLGSFVGGSVAGALLHYPSGHVMTTLIAAGALGFLLMVAVDAKRPR
jgi:MFS family permease